MFRPKKFKQKVAITPVHTAKAATKSIANSPLLPIGALLLAGSMGAMAQPNSAAADKTLKPVVVTEKAEAALGKDTLRATETTIGKGKQQLRDIPQSITVVTEKLIDDRNLDTLKEVLHSTAGVTFLAAEGGEEDIRLRGFSLATTGDIFVDGMRDPAFYERDTFNNDRIELLRGSASMLFGRGSTGGAVNQVSKRPYAMDATEISTTLGSYNFLRVTGDFNIQAGENSALRINAMATKADNNGAGSRIDKKGLAAAYRFGIGTADEVTVDLYSLKNNNGMNYGMPWIKPTATSPADATTLLPINPNSYYGTASDLNKGSADYVTLGHTHRFQDNSELKTQVRRGTYDRDQRAGTVRLSPNTTSLANFSDSTAVTRGSQLKMQDLENLLVQSDYSKKFEALGLKHELLTGVDANTDKKRVYSYNPGVTGTNSAPYLAAIGLTKPTTTVGTPNDGASIDESTRRRFLTSEYDSMNWGIYAQDLVQVAPHWKLLGGLRYDNLVGNYTTHGYTYTGTAGNHGYDKVNYTGVSGTYQMTVAGWSQRVGALYQPNELQSYHLSLGTSFNTSGETYSLSSSNTSTPPEQSYNLEFGGKQDSADKRFTSRWAAFHSIKLHERNTDPLQPGVTVLSGRRHSSGMELDITGRLTSQWEVYGSYMWMPDALIDIGGQGAEAAGSRPSLTPVHSGTVWSTYQLTSQLRVGSGVNFRSEQTPNRNPGWKAPGYATLDVMAEYKFDPRVELKLNVTNVLDKLYADALYSGHYIPGAGRNYQATLNVKF
ncbi:MAG: TonB-dependent receptor [Burkholderiales bacterium]|nr:TonB-dependent receptor [Burkholderiales bacterium]